MKTLAERLKYARESKGKIWTQKHLAVACGLSTGAIGMLESGQRGNKDGSVPGTVPKIAKALGVRYDWLAYGEEPMQPSEPQAKQEVAPSVAAIEAMDPGVQELLVQLGTLLSVIPEDQRGQAYLEASNALLRTLQSALPKRAQALPGLPGKPPA